MAIAEKLEEIRKHLHGAKLIVISKTVEAEKILEAQRQGINCFGESYIQEAEEKIPQVNSLQKAEWHFVGHLQGNKARKAVEMFDVIQSIDSESLAKKLNSCAKTLGKAQEVMIQVNLTDDASKFGIRPEATLSFAKDISKFKNLNLTGIMAMAPPIGAEKTRPYFRQMKIIFDIVQKHYPSIKWLSMGMSNDYLQATDEGSNMVRLGSAIFGDQE